MLIQCTVKKSIFPRLAKCAWELLLIYHEKSNHQCDISKESWVISHVVLLDLEGIPRGCDYNDCSPWVGSISGYKHSLLQEGYGPTTFSHPGYRPTLGSSPQDRGQIQGLEDSERDWRGSQGPLSSWLGHGQPHLGYTTQCQATAGLRRTSQGKRMGNYAENPHSNFNPDAIELGLKDQKDFNHIFPPWF